MDNHVIKLEMNDSDLEYIKEQLFDFNLSMAPVDSEETSSEMHLALKDGNGEICGGLVGKIYRYCLYIDILWIRSDLRSKGYGKKLLGKAEEIAISKECNFIHLDTFSFQAPKFYESNGYEIFGILDGYPDGIKRYYLRKDLK